MIKALKIEGLRGIAHANLQGLGPLTILVGPNGSAKSTVLEAAGVACAGGDVAEALGALMTREWLGNSGLGHVLPSKKAMIETPFSGLAPLRSYITLELRSTSEDGTGHSVARVLLEHSGQAPNNARVDDDGLITPERAGVRRERFAFLHAFVDRPAGAARRYNRAPFSSALREALGQIKLSPFYDEVFANIQALRPSLVSIESVPVGDRDEPFMFEKTAAGRVGYPVAFAGDGFRRTLLLAAGFASGEKGVVAIDEPDAFAHPTMFERLAGLIRRSVDQGTQVIYATHNMEFIGATLRAFHDKLEALSVFGLQLVDGRLDHVRIPGSDAERRVHELGHDLRL